MIDLIPFRLSYRDFTIYDGTHKAHMSGHSILEFSTFRGGVLDFLGSNSVSDGCTSKIVTVREAKYHTVASQKVWLFDNTHKAHISSRIHVDISLVWQFSRNFHSVWKGQVCVLCVSYQLFLPF